MKNENNVMNRSIELSVEHNKSNIKDLKMLTTMDIVLTLVLFIVIEITFLSMFSIQNIKLVTLILGSIVIILLYIGKRTRFIVNIIVLISFIFLLLFAKNNVIDGFLVILNDIFQSIGKNSGIILPEYKIELTGYSKELFANIIWIYLSLFVSISLFMIVKYNKLFIHFAIIMGVISIQVVGNIHVNLFLNIALLLISILILLKSYIQSLRDDKFFSDQRGKVLYLDSFIILLLFSCSIFLIFSIQSTTDYQKNKYIDQVRNYFQTKIDDFRFEKDKTNTFTKGDFTQLGEIQFFNEPALEVIMDKPASLYLRGFVGSNYTSERWSDLDSKTYYENRGLYYWLNKEGFNPLSQLSTINSMNEENKKIGEKVNVTINNLNGHSKFLYTPYELSSDAEQFENVRLSDYSMISSSQFFGDRSYRYEINSELLVKYPSLANVIYQQNANETIDHYVKNESHYNEYVYQHFTKLPSNIQNILEGHIEVTSSDDENHVSYEEAIEFVRTYLYRTITYKVNPTPLPEGQDFVVHLLENSQEGYATHFATAATLMFRYLNIPARYVEGYLVTPKDIEGKDNFEKIELTGKNAHAWTEIYLDEIGWIPIEVTPPYYHVMEQTDLSEYPKGENEKDTQSRKEAGGGADDSSQKVSDKQKENKNNLNREKNKSIWSNYKLYLYIILVIASLLIIGYFTNRRYKLFRLKKSFQQSPVNVAAKKIFSYVLYLLQYDGLEEFGGSVHTFEKELHVKYGKEYVMKYKQAVHIYQKAMYSGKEITEENRQFLIGFTKDTLFRITESKNFLQRMKMRFWDFVY
ncbi:transglutaminase-like domain-containing protein [Pseudogracilibacillus sp. SO30301A]|uniref:transglutaminase-like domain-containing protein n=1 Tax=Pseudogracilibacillus sp. SO30301A TaxID=3098291 RepID=UPI00300E2CF1